MIPRSSPGPRPSARPDETILLCEGEPDTLCALSKGFHAITQTSKTNKYSKDQEAKFRGRDVVICYDADGLGQDYAAKHAKALTGVAKSVRLLAWPDYMGRLPDGSWPKKHGEDLTDFRGRAGMCNRWPPEPKAAGSNPALPTTGKQGLGSNPKPFSSCCAKRLERH
ncbi:toprim domain-containing protein [Desulfocurvibacter africanus]|uniref:toprim domain-containing protein n=1 Tax=Desulfocurvibacter africanus TaxID=873 RepID=UPI0011D2C31B|nr:toprim domain-containing protein [Desulfocurvibacter africanus]